jgi:hypothetical protein
VTLEQDGIGLTRTEKFRACAMDPLVQNHLRVCWQNRSRTGNCSTCTKCLLAMFAMHTAHLRAPHFEPGTAVQIETTVEHQRKRADATVRALPFFDPERKRA